MAVRTIDTGLPQSPLLAVATLANGVLCTTQVPQLADGGFETGSMLEQARRTFANLDQTLRAAGGSLSDLMQVLIYLTDVGEVAHVNTAWDELMPTPRPNRGVIGTSALAIPGIGIEVVAYAAIDA